MKNFPGKIPAGFAVILTAISIFAACETDRASDDPPAYSTGDTGPAGGLVFLVEGGAGSYTYYEAAPADCESAAAWGLVNIAVGTESAAGTGKANTAAMLAAGPDDGTAAKLCDAYTAGGKDDWFLPSYGELKAMLLNLHLNGKGGFAAAKYWCSTEQGPAHYASAIDFSATAGALISTGRSTNCTVRPVRSFN